MATKYVHKHIQLAISFKDVLKKEAIGKPFNELVCSDFQEWYVPFCWKYARGTSILDEDGKTMDESDVHEFGFAAWKKGIEVPEEIIIEMERDSDPITSVEL